MAADEPEDVAELDVDDEELDEDSLPFSLDDEADVADGDDDEDGEGGSIDLEAALAIDVDEPDLVADEDEDDEDDEDEPVREGEFVCNGCHMVFRMTAMANTKARLCRDCA
ncbi:MAG: hypothetical protein R3249_00195 [Nitriliruptorales bacterium]|nr:hypothetical protein [Nitriliruptorales bacterium]